MKGILSCCLTLLATLGLFAQQEPLFSSYRTHALVINPAVAGTETYRVLRLSHRIQWRHFPGAPRTTLLSFHSAVDEKNGLGALVFRDALGPSLRHGLQLSYAYHLPLGYPGEYGQNTLSFGLGLKMSQYHFRADKVYFIDGSDPVIFEAMGAAWQGDLTFGAYWRNDRWFAGFSAPNLIQRNLSAGPNGSASILSTLYRHYFGYFGYRFQYESFSVEPSVLLKKVESAPYQIEGTVKFFLVDEQLMLGLSYRTDWLMTFLFGVHTRKFHFQYSADFISNPARPTRTFGPSHEFTLGFDLGHDWRIYYQEE